MRSGTIHRLHVSEFGKICAKYPDKAAEVVTGSIPAVPTNGVLVIESTAEGREGEFFDMVQRAEALDASKARLTPKDYRFHFYAWWQEPKYRLDSGTVAVSIKQHEYFDNIELLMLCKLDPDQRAWYVATMEADFSGAEERMWQEYPSTPAEAFQVSTEGNYYAKDMILLRKRGGVTRVPVLDLPVNTFWDIGNSDGCAIFFHQELRGEDRFIDYYEAHNEDLRHYVKEMKERGYQQDSLNSGTAKLRWGLSAVRTTRTKGATSLTSAQLRKMVGRADADIELNADHMSKPGAMFKVERDFQLNAQQMQLLDNARAAIVRVGPASSGFMGKAGTATSGLQEQTQVDQSNQSLGRMMDMFRQGRALVGELLLSMIVEDIGDQEHTIVIEGDGVKADRTVVLNKPEVDEDGSPYLSNDLQRIRLKVAMEEVPSTTTYRGQQLNAMSEAVKSLPDNYKAAIMPFMVSLMDVPFKKDVIEAIHLRLR